MNNPLSWSILFASFTAIVLSNGKDHHPDWPVFFGSLVLLVVVTARILYDERSQEKHIKGTEGSTLGSNVHVKQGGVWKRAYHTALVPGDIISLKSGQIVPADCRLIECDSLLVDTSEIAHNTIQTMLVGDYCFL